MCSAFGVPNFGRIVGMCHDAYKDSDEWQAYLMDKIAWERNGRKDPQPALMSHALESAIYLAWRLGNAMPKKAYACVISEMMAQCIVSHHNALHDYVSSESKTTFMDKIDEVYKPTFAITKDELIARTKIDFSTIDDSLFDSAFEKHVIDGLLDEYKKIVLSKNGDLFVRMVYSCLVDADRLDAELFGQDGVRKNQIRNDSSIASIGELLGMFERKMDSLASGANAKERINVLRTNVRNEVVSHAHEKRGIYNLVLPTGVGKTYTGMHFALEHANFHNMDRVIVLAPLTTVVDQTAMEYTSIFTDTNVVEHQCDFDVLDKVKKSEGKQTPGFRDDENEIEERMALIVENWNLPIIVTTTVQFFESLLQYKAGSTRKIHNIANSVIIIDEEQQLPINQIYPIIHTLNALVKDFGCTVVRSTATLPAFDGKIKVGAGEFIDGYFESIDLVDDVNRLFGEFKRADVVFVGKKDSDEIAKNISSYEKSYLCVVNTRKKCRKLFEKVAKKQEDKYMLSKNVCPKDRKRMVKEIAMRLRNGDKITVVATSLVEAGVDFDFDEAYREMNSLYSILQTRGRCNRNGRMANGILYVFEFSDMPIMSYEDAFSKAETTRNCLDSKTGQLPSWMGEHDINVDYSKKAIYNEGKGARKSKEDYEIAMYFSDWENSKIINIEKVRAMSSFFNYRNFGECFHMIEAHRSFPVVVRYRENANDTSIDDLICESKRHFDKKMQRKFQQYIVEVNEQDAEKLDKYGMMEELVDGNGRKLGLYVLNEKDFSGNLMYVEGRGINLEFCTNSGIFI